MTASHKFPTPLHYQVLDAADPIGLVLDTIGDALPKFHPGNVVMTAGVSRWMDDEKIPFLPYLAMHLAGYWGDLDIHDIQVNEDSIKHGMRIMSSYPQPSNGEKLWIITEADRSVTTLLFASEY